MVDSVHLAKWLRQFESSSFEFRVISSSPHRRIHPILLSLMSGNQPARYRISWFSRHLGLYSWVIDKFIGKLILAIQIVAANHSFKPDAVHILETQNAGYGYLRAHAISANLRAVPSLLTLYGSDLFWFSKFASHRRRIESLLPKISVLSAECERDHLLAANFGFRGKLSPLMPAFGPLKLEQKMSQASRRLIVVKGYQNKWGRAAIALEALKRVKGKLSSFEIVVYSCDNATLRLISRLNRREGMAIKAFPKHTLSNIEVIDLMSRALCFIGLSSSDGLPASTMEAIGSGAIPIQSNTSCAGNWIDPGLSGFLVNYSDVETVASNLEAIIDNSEAFLEKAALQAARVRGDFAVDRMKALADRTYSLVMGEDLSQ
jgi:glycosyltransferase involved in cell wall biosynthesis